MRLRLAWSCLTVTLTLAFTPARGATVDLGAWSAESYPAVSGFGAGVWTPSSGGDSVQQSVNGQPTLFYSDFTAIGTDIQGVIRVAGGDDDYIGFALGFEPGDSSSAAADFLLVDWKQGTQAFDFGPPSNTPGSTALAGLAVSRITGIPTADEFWGHTDFVSNPGGGLVELARGATLGGTGWSTNVDYTFRFVFGASRLRVFVDGLEELDVSGSFDDGRLAFYNFSQAGVTYSAFTVDVPEPSGLLLGLCAAVALVLLRPTRRAADC